MPALPINFAPSASYNRTAGSKFGGRGGSRCRLVSGAGRDGPQLLGLNITATCEYKKFRLPTGEE